jgi:hypothetical protein
MTDTPAPAPSGNTDSLNPVTLDENALRSVSIMTACAAGRNADGEGLRPK